MSKSKVGQAYWGYEEKSCVRNLRKKKGIWRKPLVDITSVQNDKKLIATKLFEH